MRTSEGVFVTQDTKTYKYDYSYQKYCEDHVTPSWHEKIMGGQVVNNNFYINEVTETVTPTIFSGTRRGDDYLTEFFIRICDDGTAGVGYCAAPSGIDDAINQLKVYVGTKARANAHSQETQALVTYGERKETLDMLKGACNTLFHLKHSLKQYGKSLLRAARAPKRFAKKLYLDAESAWMQVRMGWRPFVGELEGIHAAVTHLQEKRWKCRFASRKIAHFSNKTSGSSMRINNISNSSHDKTYAEETSVSAGIICRARLGGFPDTWGLTQIPQTVWELTTLSWCVDYFFNTADLIAACTPDTYWSEWLSWTTVNRSIEETITSKGVSSLGYGPPMSEGGRRRKHTKRILRQPGALTGLVYKGMLDFESQQQECLDTLAVARQQMTKLIKSILPLEPPRCDWRPRK